MAIVCYAHAQAPTVVTCSDCSRGLCRFCGNLVHPALCAECLERRTHALHRRIIQRGTYALVLATFVAWAVHRAPFFAPHPSAWPGVAASYLTLSAFYGAETLRQNARIQLPAVPLLRLGYWPVWWIASALLGAFTLPFLAVKAIIELQKMKQLSAMVQSRLRPSTAARVLSIKVEDTHS
jgi:hypothetical protein